MHKEREAVRVFKTYHVITAMPQEIDTHISHSDAVLTIALFSTLFVLIFLNVVLYVIYKRCSRPRIIVRDMTLVVRKPKQQPTFDKIYERQIGTDGRPRSVSQIDVRHFVVPSYDDRTSYDDGTKSVYGI